MPFSSCHTENTLAWLYYIDSRCSSVLSLVWSFLLPRQDLCCCILPCQLLHFTTTVYAALTRYLHKVFSWVLAHSKPCETQQCIFSCCRPISMLCSLRTLSISLVVVAHINVLLSSGDSTSWIILGEKAQIFRIILLHVYVHELP